MNGYVGVDLGATNLRGALVGGDGEEVRRERCGLGEDRTPEVVAERVAELVAALAVGPDRAVEAVCVGVAGWLDSETGLVCNGPNLGWRDVPFGELLTARLERPVRLVNDLSAVTFGEWRAGAGQGARHLLCVFVGSGLGAGLVLDGRLYEGATGMAGELGHVTVEPGGRPCGCGRRGCLEAYVGGHNLEARVRQEATEGRHAAALAEAGEVGALTCAHVEAAWRRGDPDAHALWEVTAGWLAIGLATGIELLNPDRLVLGGGVVQGCSGLLTLTLEALHQACAPSLLAPTRIVPAALGGWAGALGAAQLARARGR